MVKIITGNKTCNSLSSYLFDIYSDIFRYAGYFKQRLFFLFLLALMVSEPLSATIATLNGWTNLYNGASNSISTAYSIPAGSGNSRILVVAISSTTTAASARTISSITYGGQAMTLVNGDMGSSTREHTAIYYLKESGIQGAGTSTTLSITITGGTTALNSVFASTYDFVDQTTVLTNSQVYNSGTGTATTASFGTALTVNANDLALKVFSSVRIGSTTPANLYNFGTNWTSITPQTGTNGTGRNALAMLNAVGYRAVPTSNITDLSTVTISTATLRSMTGVSLKARPVLTVSPVTLAGFAYNFGAGPSSYQSFSVSGNSLSANVTLTPPTDYEISTSSGSGYQSTPLTLTQSGGTLASTTVYVRLKAGLSAGNYNSENIVVSSTNAVSQNVACSGTVYALSITTGTISGSPFCAGTNISVPYTVSGTYTSGNVYTAQLSDASGSFSSPVAIGTVTSTTSGTITATIPVATATGSGYRIRVVSNTPVVTGADNGANLTVNALAGTPTTTGTQICIGTTSGVTLLASGANTGEKYVWYDAQSGGNILKTSTDNTDNTYTTPVLTATTNYWVSIINAGGCESSRVQVTATYPANSPDSQTTAGTNTWIGHVYDGTNQSVAYNGSFTNYFGYSTEPETFNEGFGGATNCYGINSSLGSRSIYTETFSVRYRMNSTRKGLYTVDLGSDDGSRLAVDGVLVYNNWGDQAFSSKPGVLINLTGSSSLVYDFYENGGQNQVVFQNPTLILANNLTANLTQTILSGTSGAAISGDVFGTLPGGISLSGTGYQWTYSTSPTGTRTVISGATGATYTPDASVAPFNTAGTYYIFRNAVLSSANNVSPNPAVLTNESNYATLNVYQPTITVSPTSLSGFNYAVGSGPSASQSFTVSGSNLSDNVVLTLPADYEISLSSSSGYQSTALTLTQSGGSVAPTTIYVRLKAGLSAASYNSENIVVSTTGVTSQNVSCSGTVGVKTLNTSINSLSNFSYSYGAGPSAEQTFSVSGSYLYSNVTVTPSSNFEISLTSGSGFQSTAITLTPVNGIVSATTIYVRLKAGLTVNNYMSDNVTVASTGITSQIVNLSGYVYSAYCTSSGNTTYNTSVTKVVFNTINNSSAKPSGYSDYTSQITNVLVNNPYSLTVNVNTDGAYTVYATVWIDWNHNGSFSDAGETYSMGTATNVANGATSLSPLTVTIPASAVLGYTRMRVSVEYGTAPTACGTGFDGEVEDYTLNVVLPTITTGSISSSAFSAGGSVSVPFTSSGTFSSGNVYTAQLSSSTGSFASPVNIGTLTSVANSGSISATIPSNAVNGSGYRIRVVSSSPAVTGTDNGTNLTVTGNPIMNISPNSLSNFTYAVGYGPSAEQSFTVSGYNLTGNITLTPSTHFEISTGTGSSFVASSLITLPVVNGTVASKTIYVRMKAGLALGSYSTDSIIAASVGLTNQKVSLNGTVVVDPVLTASTVSGTATYVFGTGPSAEKTFTIGGTNLLDSVTVTPPADYEISKTTGTGYVSTPLKFAQSGGSLATTTVYVRLKSNLSVGNYSENAVVSTKSASPLNVALTGSVTSSTTIFNTPASLSGFIYASGSGPSGIQSFVVKAIMLTTDVTATPPANFEISKDGVAFQSTALTLTRSGTTLTSDTIVYVRMKAGLTVGTYGPLNSSVVLATSGAVTKSVACTGRVVSSATVLISPTTLTGFGYEQNHGPSVSQSFTVSGAMLTSGITITAPTDYEVSLTSSSGYTSSITLPGTQVNPTKIYVRLKSGRVAGSYGTLATPEVIGVTSTSGISCIGKVFSSPLIAAGGGGSYCAGSPINLTSSGSDIQSQYWTGPNSFYSTLANPQLTTNATTSLSGTYKVNGSVQVGGNLITNGDFEAGNTSFSSSYNYVDTTSTTALYPEGDYTVVKIPHSVHPNFSYWPDHTTGHGLQMVVNGASTAGVVIWSQSVPVIPGATYQFTYWEQTVNVPENPKNPSQLQLYVNGVAAGPVYTAPAVNNVWAMFQYNAQAGNNQILNLELINENTIASGNDFALDDISFYQILPAVDSAVVVVNPILPVSVSVTANPGTSVYTNTPVTFTATPTNGGTSPAYQWKVNGTAVGTGSTYTYTPSNGDVVSCTLTSSLSCVSNNPASASVTMTVTYRANYWMGYIDTDWGKTGNWTANYIPATGDDVEYATIANFGANAMNDLQLDKNRTIGSLINATTKRLLVPAGLGLIVNNTVNTDGNPDRIYISSSSSSPTGTLIYHNDQSHPVSATVEMYSKASWNLADTINNKYKWQYFGIPLQSVVANPTFYGSYVRKWYETGTTIQNHWIQLGNDSVLYPFYGYEICQAAPKTVVFKGQLVNSDFSSGSMAITPTALFPGQHIFANPYTAAIDIRQLVFGVGTEASVYLYNTGTFSVWQLDGGHTSSATNEGQYLVVPQNTAGNLDLPVQIPSMQAMLVKATTAVSDSFAISYNNVVMVDTVMQRVRASSNVVRSNLTGTIINVVGANYSDRMWLFTNPGCKPTFDNGWDGFKLAGKAFAPQIYGIGPDGNYQVMSTNNINNTDIAFQAGIDTEYTLIFTNTNVQDYYTALYLYDNVENRTVDITQSGSEYTFTAQSTPTPQKRFRIVAVPYEQNAVDKNAGIKIFGSSNVVFVDNLSSNNGDLYIYDIAGHFIRKEPFSMKTITSVNLNVSPGAYIVRAVTTSEDISKRIILN